MNIDQLIEHHRDRLPDDQRVSWNRTMWERVWDEASGALPARETLDLIDAQGGIRRPWLRELADGDPAIFLTATTIWGYGSFSRGVKALRAMLHCRGEDVRALTSEVIGASRQSPDAGFRSLYNDHGGKRIPWLGTAYGTKVVHFAGYDHTDPKPLILDKRVWTGIMALEDTPAVPDPARYMPGAQYQEYCAWASGAASRHHGATSELVEYALFTYGGEERSRQRDAARRSASG